jgi:hypothetical protein
MYVQLDLTLGDCLLENGETVRALRLSVWTSFYVSSELFHPTTPPTTWRSSYVWGSYCSDDLQC